MVFGAKTRSGAGAFLTTSGGGSTSSADWSVDASGYIAATGTYGAYKAYGASSYALTLPDASASSIVLESGEATVRALPTDSSGSSQLRTILGIASGANGALVLGDRVVCRTSDQQPSNLNDMIAAPAGLWAAGAGSRITVQSEEPATGNDADGHPRRGGGYRMGKLYLSGPAGVAYPLDFVDISFYTDAATPGTTTLGAYQNGYGANFYRCLIACGPNVLPGSVNGTLTGFNIPGSAVFQECHFENLNDAVQVNAVGPLTVTHSVFKNLHSDGLKPTAGPSGNLITDNFFTDWAPATGNNPPATSAHPDTVQILTGSTVEDWGSYLRNISIRGVGVLNLADAQGFYGNPGTGNTIGGIVCKNNIHFLTAGNQFDINAPIDPDVRFNTFITDPYANTSLSAANILTRAIGGAGSGGTFTHNVVAGSIDASLQTGTTITTPNVQMGLATPPSAPQLAAYIAALQVMFPNFSGYTTPGTLKTRAAVLQLFTPADLAVASGGLKNPDGTFNGALFPATPGNPIGAWNDGTAFSPDDPKWVAAHPAAA